MDSDFLMYALTSLEHPETWSIVPDDELPGYYALCASLRPEAQEVLGEVQGVVVVASHGDVEALMAVRAAFGAAYEQALMAVRAAFGAAYEHHSETAWEFTGDVVHLPEELA